MEHFITTSSLKGVNKLNRLEHARTIIDDCDKKLVEVFEQRLNAVVDVLKYKRENKIPIFQPEREKEIFKKIDSYLNYKEFSEEFKDLYSQILKISRKLQSKHLFPYNIVIIGFIGSGKTSVSKELSILLEMEHVDIDELIIKNSGISIGEIFSSYGEIGLRELERNVIEDLNDTKNTIISCGGDVVLSSENIDLLKQNGKLIWLKASSETIYHRLLDDSSRPPLKNSLTIEGLSNELNNRLSLYECASDIVIDTDGKDIENIAKEIIERLLSL